jgi:hypothetical protein
VNGKQQKKVLNASSPLGIDFGPRNELTQWPRPKGANLKPKGESKVISR